MGKIYENPLVGYGDMNWNIDLLGGLEPDFYDFPYIGNNSSSHQPG